MSAVKNAEGTHRVATLHLDAVDRQPVSILNELKARLKEAPQVPGTKLD